MQTLLETALMALSAMALLMIGPVIVWLWVAARRKRAKVMEHALTEHDLAKTDLDVEGFKVKVDLAKMQIRLTAHPEPLCEKKIVVETATGSNTFYELDSRYRVLAKKNTLANLRSDPARLAPFFDFLLVWSNEVKLVSFTHRRATLRVRRKWREGSSASFPLSVDRLQNLVAEAALALRTFFQAATIPAQSTDQPATALPRWLLRHPRLTKTPLLVLVGGLVAAWVASGFASWHYWSVYRDRQAMKWPSVEGSMITSRVKHTHSTRGRGSDKTESDSYRAILKYRYQVKGETYEGSRFSFLNRWVTGESDSRKVVVRYQQGRPVTVYYNPRDPGDAVIHREGKAQSALDLLFWASVYLPALALLLLWWWIRRTLRATEQRLRQMSG